MKRVASVSKWYADVVSTHRKSLLLGLVVVESCHELRRPVLDGLRTELVFRRVLFANVATAVRIFPRVLREQFLARAAFVSAAVEVEECSANAPLPDFVAPITFRFGARSQIDSPLRSSVVLDGLDFDARPLAYVSTLCI